VCVCVRMTAFVCLFVFSSVLFDVCLFCVFVRCVYVVVFGFYVSVVIWLLLFFCFGLLFVV